MNDPKIDDLMNDPIEEALKKLGVSEDSPLDCKLFRVIGTGGRQTKEWVSSYDYAPEIEEIASEHGSGHYQMKISSGGKTVTAGVRIASKNAVAMAGELPAVTNPFMEFEKFLTMGKMFKEMFGVPQQVAPLAGMDITPMIMENARQLSASMYEMQKEHQRQMLELRERYEQEEEEEEEMEAEDSESGFDIDSILPVVVEYLPQLLGKGGQMLVPIVKGIPIFQKIRNSIPLAQKILDGVQITDDEKIKLIKLLGLPSELIP